METTTTNKEQVISQEELLEHLKGHQRLTRRTIEAFPEDKLFSYSIGGMRTFADLIQELLGVTAPGIKEIATQKPAELQESFDHQNKKRNCWKPGINQPLKLTNTGHKYNRNVFTKP